MNQEEFNKKMVPLIRGIKSLELEIDVLGKAKLALVTEMAVSKSGIKIGDLITWGNGKPTGRVYGHAVEDLFHDLDDLQGPFSRFIDINFWVVTILKDGRDGKKKKINAWETPRLVQGSAP